jgi:hypothetical protein
MNRVQIKFINDAQDQEYKLSEWESVFINDLANKPDHYELTDKQNEILNRIQKKLD